MSVEINPFLDYHLGVMMRHFDLVTFSESALPITANCF